MRTTITACIAATALALGACGGSDAAGGDQGEVADLVMEAADEQGFELDESCVNDTVAELSDEDAKALVDAGLEAEADVSDAGRAIGQQVFTDCVDADSYMTALVDSITAEDPSLDADCIKSALEGKSVEEIQGQLVEVAFGCSTDG